MRAENVSEHNVAGPAPDHGLEPIAIVGMGLRFPGGIRSPQQYWDFMAAQRAAVREVPQQRWDAYAALSPGSAKAVREAIRFGSYLDDIAGFDAEFFGISPREAELMDPQQRITLEVAWETLEHAGIPPATLAGSDTGVFMGVCTDDYGRRLLEDLPHLEAWMGIGSSLCGVANRVSYVLDLHGPSVSVDTACSASLVAIHQACQSLRLGDTGLALAGGVMLVTSPAYALVLEAAGALSPDGRSKAFDASADGYGRGEGCGILALKRLSDARRDGDQVLGLIRGSAVRQDGRTNGIMAPSQAAQEELVREACRQARVSPSSLDYVEAHGTGTALGDPIEVGALSAVVGAGRAPHEPCLIGSVKTNIGHLEAASGIAGVIKLVLAMRHSHIPATLSVTGLNPDINWADSGLKVVHELTPWPRTDRPRLAGTGNYGYGGTIAHVIVEEAPADNPADPTPVRPAAAGPRIYPLSAASPAGVGADAAALADRLSEDPGLRLGSIGHTLAHRRSPLAARACVVAADRADLTARLRQLAAGQHVTGVSSGQVVRSAVSPDAVWVFSGHGSQWTGMGRELLADEPAVAQTMDELRETYLDELGFDPRQALHDDDYHLVDRAQAMIFAMQVALTRIWYGYGLQPAAIIGHSVGEIAAAVAAGMLDLPDGARLICRRSRLLRQVAGSGAMAMVNLPFDEVAARLSGHRDVSAAIAAAPMSTVVSGPAPAVLEIMDQWQSEDLVVRRVNSDVAFHSTEMDGLLPELVSGVAGITAHPPTVPVYSTAFADSRTDTPRDPAYWAANLRNPVRLHQAIRAAVKDGHRIFLEISAHPVVQHSIDETLAATGVDDGMVAHSLRRDQPERATLLDNLGALHCHGVPVDWSVLQPGGELVDLPTRAWQHRRYWADAVPNGSRPQQHDVDSHTLLGPRTAVQGTSPILMWRTYLDFAIRPYPGQHAVLGTEVVPAAVLLTTFFVAAHNPPATDIALREVALRVPLVAAMPHELQVVQQDGALRLSSRLTNQDDDQSWLTHATAQIAEMTPDPHRLDPATLRDEYPEVLDPGCVAERLTAIGVVGIGFPWQVEAVRRRADGMLATVTADPLGGPPRDTWASLVDAALSVAPVVFPGDPLLRMPGQFREVSVRGAPPETALVVVRLVDPGPDHIEVDVDVLTLDGLLAASFTGVRFGAVQKEVLVELGPSEEPTEEPALPPLTGREFRDYVLATVREVAAAEVRVAPDELDVHRPLAELGADSLMTVAIRLRLERRFQVPVPTTLLWNRPTVAAVADYLSEQLATATTTA